jgi:hypothetical protein
MRINAPPPIPEDAGFTTPKHKTVATAESIAFPPLSRNIVNPTSEHSLLSDATAPLAKSSTDSTIKNIINHSIVSKMYVAI